MNPAPAVQIEALPDGRLKFSGGGTFAALRAAERWLADRDISYGSLQRGAPVGLMRGQVDISKWRNLSDAEIDALHGRMTSFDFRFGPIYIGMVGEQLTVAAPTTTHTYINITPSYHAQLQSHYSDGHCLHIRTPAGILTLRISTDSSGRDISAHLFTAGAARTTFGTWLQLSAPACVRVLRTVTAHSHLWIGSAWLELPAEHTDAVHAWLRTHIGDHCAEHTSTFEPPAEAA